MKLHLLRADPADRPGYWMGVSKCGRFPEPEAVADEVTARKHPERMCKACIHFRDNPASWQRWQ